MVAAKKRGRKPLPQDTKPFHFNIEPKHQQMLQDVKGMMVKRAESVGVSLKEPSDAEAMRQCIEFCFENMRKEVE